MFKSMGKIKPFFAFLKQYFLPAPFRDTTVLFMASRRNNSCLIWSRKSSMPSLKWLGDACYDWSVTSAPVSAFGFSKSTKRNTFYLDLFSLQINTCTRPTSNYLI